ncbi:DUF4190 domain-containing protein [Micromonospora sp. NPDC003197]
MHRPPTSQPSESPFSALPQYPSAPTGDESSSQPYQDRADLPDLGVNGFAVASLILGIIGGLVLSVVFGIVALVQIRRRPYRGKGLAIAGLAVSASWVLLFALFAAAIPGTDVDRDADGQVTNGGTVSTEQLRPGDCVNDLNENDYMVSDFPAVPCAEPHEGEVYAVVPLPEADWPGEREVARQAEQSCYVLLTRYATAVDPNLLDVFYLVPMERGWIRGNRDIVCIATDPSGKRTGSIRG